MIAPLRHIVLACAAAAALAACSKPEQQMPPPPEVGVIEAKPQSVPLQRDLVGRLSPFRSADVRARVPGVLLKRVYAEGSEVKEGQLLFQIDPAPLRASLAAAEAQLASAQASYTNAKSTATRARGLAPQGYVSKSDLDNAEAAERSSAAAVQQAQAAVTSARISLGYASVTAPISGRAGKQQVTEGALVGQGEATLLTTVDQIDPLYVNFSMSADELQLLRQAQTRGAVALNEAAQASIRVELADGGTYGHEGTLDFSDTTVDPTTGAVSLRARLPNPERILLPGSFVTFKATLGERKDAYLVPQQALLRDTNGGYVYVVGKDGNVARKNVTVDGQQGNSWQVTGGLEPGDQVVVSGVQKVKEGAPAKAVAWQPQATPGNEGAAAPQAGAEPAAQQEQSAEDAAAQPQQ
jgi:membrane fusion protein (multidrug efflux system)